MRWLACGRNGVLSKTSTLHVRTSHPITNTLREPTNFAFLENPAVAEGEFGRVVVEMKLEHSKTGFSRYLDMAGTTKTSGITRWPKSV